MNRLLSLLVVLSFVTPACAEGIGEAAGRKGDEIVVCGQYFHTTAPVVLWTDPGGYDAYRVERRFSDIDKAEWEESKAEVQWLDTPNRYGIRKEGLTDDQLELVRGGGWPLELLQGQVDQFVMHYDVCGFSRRCFQVLHDARGLSVHFMLDVDGTIYQTLDLKERAWHATKSNGRSVGIEIAQMGAYPPDNTTVLDKWYTNTGGGTILSIPEGVGPTGIRTPRFIGRPARPGLIRGNIQNTELLQYDFTPQQYDSLIKLTAALCTIFPKMQCDYPRDDAGNLVTKVLTEQEWRDFQGLIGHYHIQTNKTDPGPAFDWDKVVTGARELMPQ